MSQRVALNATVLEWCFNNTEDAGKNALRLAKYGGKGGTRDQK